MERIKPDRSFKEKLFMAGYEDGFLQVEDLSRRPLVNVPGEVRLGGCPSRIEWRYVGKEEAKQTAAFARAALLAFVQVTSPEAVVAFVSRWGCLRLFAREEAGGWQSEALDVYFQHARQLRAVLCLAADLRSKARPEGGWTNVTDWRDATQGFGDGRFWATSEVWSLEEQPDRERQRFELGRLVNEYLLPEAYCRPQMAWDGNENPKLTLSMNLYVATCQWQKQRSDDQWRMLQEVQRYEPEKQRWDSLPAAVRRSLPARKRPSHLLAAMILETVALLLSPLGACRCTYLDCGQPHVPTKRPRGASYCSEECKRLAHNAANRRCHAKPPSEKKLIKTKRSKAATQNEQRHP